MGPLKREYAAKVACIFPREVTYVCLSDHDKTPSRWAIEKASVDFR